MNRPLFAEVRRARWPFVHVLVLTGGLGVLIVAQAWLLSNVIARVHLGGETLAEVTWQFLLLVLVVLGRAGVVGLRRWQAGQLSLMVRGDLRSRLVRKLLALGPRFVQGERSGELANTATTGVETLDAFLRDYIPGLFLAAVVPLTILVLVLPIDALTFVVLLVTAPLVPVFMVLIGMSAGQLARTQYASLSRLSAHFLDVLRGLTTLKLLNRLQQQVRTIYSISDQYRRTTLDVLRVAFMSAFALELVATLSIGLVAVEIGLRLLRGGIGFQQALFLLVLAPEFYAPLRGLGARWHAATESAAAAERIFEILALDEPASPSVSRPVPSSKAVAFEGVSFSYPDASGPAVNGVSFTLGEGEHVALVGPSGAGKSTLAAMLLGFIQPDSGRIAVGGTSLAAFDMTVWREQVAWVPQRPHVFATTVASNLRLARPDATDAELEAAARAVQAHDFIMALPDGYATQVGEGGYSLSGGQSQRLAIARAFLSDAPILVLDEATANLDPDTEAEILASLTRLRAGRSVLSIAHRLNTTASADRIVVLDGGRVVAQGTHDMLLASSTAYGTLVSVWLRASEGHYAAR